MIVPLSPIDQKKIKTECFNFRLWLRQVRLQTIGFINDAGMINIISQVDIIGLVIFGHQVIGSYGKFSP